MKSYVWTLLATTSLLAPAGLKAQPYVYVSSVSGNVLNVINAANGSSAASIRVPAGPTGSVITPNGSAVYVTSQGANSVSVISTSSNTLVNTIGVGSTPIAAAVNPSGTLVYVVNKGSNTVSVVNTASQSVVATIGVGSSPAGVAFSPDGTRAFVTNLLSGTISVIDTGAQAVVATFSALSGPNGIAVAPNGQNLYIANQYSGAVTVQSASSGAILATVWGFSSPTSMAVTPSGNRVFVVDTNAGIVGAIDTGSNSLLGQIAVGSLPMSIAVSADGSHAYVANEFSFSLSVLDTVNDYLSGTISGVGVYPVAVAMAPAAVAPPPPPSSQVSFAGLDTSTLGNWKSMYGSQGYDIVGDGNTNTPTTVGPSGQGSYTWAGSTTDVRALQKSSASDRIAATWFSGGSFTIDINLTDGSTHQVAVYCLDWDYQSRSQTITVVDAVSGAVMDSRSISGFGNGAYLVWNIKGHVRLQVTRTAGPNAVLSGVFFGGGLGASSAAAQFVEADSWTMGNWKGTYGANGYTVIGDSAAYPSFATVNPAGQSFYTWAGSTSDPRALQKNAASDRIAATWFSGNGFTIDINLTDGGTHQIAVYCLDWDYQNRAETIKVLDASSGAVLDSRSLSGFANGQYLVWKLTGHVKLQVTQYSGPNAVISGLFF